MPTFLTYTNTTPQRWAFVTAETSVQAVETLPEAVGSVDLAHDNATQVMRNILSNPANQFVGSLTYKKTFHTVFRGGQTPYAVWDGNDRELAHINRASDADLIVAALKAYGVEAEP